jgi:hypothetical protein
MRLFLDTLPRSSDEDDESLSEDESISKIICMRATIIIRVALMHFVSFLHKWKCNFVALDPGECPTNKATFFSVDFCRIFWTFGFFWFFLVFPPGFWPATFVV